MSSESIFPPDFVRRMERLLGEETPAFLRSLEHPPAGLRVNTLRLSPRSFEELSPFPLTALPFPPAGYLVGEGARPGKHPYHAAGLYYLQDPGAMAVAAAVAPEPGERVLDLAAAPGGKATHLAALLGGTGLLVANDVQPVRARELAGNLERLGVREAIVTSDGAERLAEHFGPFFDRVLLDAPCSGESMFAKSEAARREWSEAAVLGCARRQVELLAPAARMVRPGGLLVYSTCTFSEEENEGAVAAFLREHPDFAPAALPPIPGAEGESSVRLWPHRVPGAGHFIAAFRRVSGGEGPTPAGWATRAPREATALLDAFAREYLRGEAPLGERVAAWGEELYRIPREAPEMGKVRVVRPGWWLGTPLKNRFEPSHALALALRRENGVDPVVLAPDDPRTLAYLRGEAIRVAGASGWTLVTVDGFPLGWGKRVGDLVKNHYPRGLRWR